VRFLLSAVAIGPSMLLPPVTGAARRIRAGHAVLIVPARTGWRPVEPTLGQPATG